MKKGVSLAILNVLRGYLELGAGWRWGVFLVVRMPEDFFWH